MLNASRSTARAGQAPPSPALQGSQKAVAGRSGRAGRTGPGRNQTHVAERFNPGPLPAGTSLQQQQQRTPVGQRQQRTQQHTSDPVGIDSAAQLAAGMTSLQQQQQQQEAMQGMQVLQRNAADGNKGSQLSTASGGSHAVQSAAGKQLFGLGVLRPHTLCHAVVLPHSNMRF